MLDDDYIDLLASASEIQRNRLYFVAFKKNVKPKSTPNSHYFSIDEDFVYENFYNDFGPLNICMLYRYCQKLNTKLNAKCHANKRLIHYTTMNPAKRLNAAYLIGSYSIIYMNKTPVEAYRPLVAGDIPAYTRFCDASYGPSGYKISLIDCLNAVYKALKAGFFNFDDFDAEEYEYFERVENGDFNWIVPQKFIAFCGPHQKSKTLPNGYPCHSPETYFEYFRENNVTTVIRLNAKVYHASSFENAGFDHKDLFFIDGSTPSDLILKKFLAICENTKGAIAVHCKAGLGRTGSLIGAYIMKHYNFSALEAIAWLRLCRPGSVIGHQQQWMEDKQSWLWSEGERMRRRTSCSPPIHKYGIYSISLKTKLSTGSGLLPLTQQNENSEVLLTRVKGISQKVDTMHLHDATESAMETNGKSMRTRARPIGVSRIRKKIVDGIKLADGGGSVSEDEPSKEENENDDDGNEEEGTGADDDDDEEEEDTSQGTFIVTRRRKSPGATTTTPTATVTTPAPTPATATTTIATMATAATTSKVAAVLLDNNKPPTPPVRRTPPVNEHKNRATIATEPLYLEKKPRKPATTTFDVAQRHTIASTVKMSAMAVEKQKAQTQGDKLNQIKAMRRQQHQHQQPQHNSRVVNTTNSNFEYDGQVRHLRARSQPFRNNNNNIVNILSTTTPATTPITTTTASLVRHAECNDSGGGGSNAGPLIVTRTGRAGTGETEILINHYNNNNNNNNNSNNNNININNNNINPLTAITSSAASATHPSGGITTRARSLAIYTKRYKSS